jgi:hypothetical protein
MDGLKESKQAVAAEVLTSLTGFAPPALLALGTRLVSRAPRLGFETAATNVPGPQHPVFTLGRRLLEVFPYAPPAGVVRVVTAIFSYDGALTFGIAGDWDSAPDIDVLASGIESGLAQLVEAATKVTAPAKPRRTPRPSAPARAD